MTQPIEDLIDIYSPFWPGEPSRCNPAISGAFASSGLVDLDLRRATCRYMPVIGIGRPIRFAAAPLTEPSGGAAYIQGHPTPADLAALMRLLRVDAAATDYAAFLVRAADPLEERFLTQLRLIRVPALVGIYQALSPDETRLFPDQRQRSANSSRHSSPTSGSAGACGRSSQRRPTRTNHESNRRSPSASWSKNAHYGVIPDLEPRLAAAAVRQSLLVRALRLGRIVLGAARPRAVRAEQAPCRAAHSAGHCPRKLSERQQFAAAIAVSR
jgi:hypothetical protein